MYPFENPIMKVRNLDPDEENASSGFKILEFVEKNFEQIFYFEPRRGKILIWVQNFKIGQKFFWINFWILDPDEDFSSSGFKFL